MARAEPADSPNGSAADKPRGPLGLPTLTSQLSSGATAAATNPSIKLTNQLTKSMFGLEGLL
jgi:hypothetical protein